MVYLIEQIVEPSQWRLKELSGKVGALAEFSGIVRDEEKGKSIEALIYQIYPGMTEKELKAVELETRQKHEVLDMVVVHRYGRIAVGEIALWIQVACKHRKEAFEAVETCISRIKEVVPIWKVESE